MRSSDGYTLMELLVALALSVLLLAALMPLWTGVLRATVERQERIVQLQRWRVAAVRFERDLTAATAGGRSRLGCGPILEASRSRVTMITRSAIDGTQEIVSWEVVGRTLMRRRAPMPLADPPAPGPFTDNKTMLEGLGVGALSYRAGAIDLGSDCSPEALSRVDSVALECTVGAFIGDLGIPVSVGGSVGR
jgi:prepilin-type N-terminal cleavage/methylation domain-containing protein